MTAAPDGGERRVPLGAWIRDHYLTIDPRTLGLFRLVLGFLFCADCIRHFLVARLYYSNAGVLSNHFLLWRPFGGHNFSLFSAFSSPGEVYVAFALALFCHACFFVGYRTRLFSVLSFLWVTSLDNRLVLVENGGYVVVNLLALWAMFLPLGRRFSVDAWREALRRRTPSTASELSDRSSRDAERAPYVSLVVLLATLNLATVYFFNVVNKSGSIWRHGETVHYVLWLNRMVTGLAVFFREHLPHVATRVLTWGTLVMEGLLPTLILAPRGRRTTRPLAMGIMWTLHGTFGVMMRLGPFSWFMIGWSFLLPGPEVWAVAERWLSKRAPSRVVVYDRRSPLAFAMARVLSELDGLSRLSFEASAEDDPHPPLVAARDPSSGAWFRGRRALDEVLRAIPAGVVLRPLLPVVTLGALDALLARVSRRRAPIARFFGLTLPARARVAPPPSPVGKKLGRARSAAREALLAYLGLCAVSQVLNENKSIPPAIPVHLGKIHFEVPIKHTQPKIVQATIQYPRIFQGWGMFAPNPIQDDGVLAIDARTIDGRHVDPLTGAPPDLDLTDARGMGLSQIAQDYANRIRLDGNGAYRQELRDYLLRWHHETGRPEDEIVAFDVYWVKAMCPRPGDTKMYDNEAIPILTYRKPRFEPPPGQPPLSPSPKTRSAGK